MTVVFRQPSDAAHWLLQCLDTLPFLDWWVGRVGRRGGRVGLG